MQAKALYKIYKKKLGPLKSSLKFKFGDGSFRSMGKVKMHIQISKENSISFFADVIQAEIPLLLGLDVLDKEKLVVNNVKNEIWNYKQNWVHAITRKFDHCYVVWQSARKFMFYTKAELTKLHRHF